MKKNNLFKIAIVLVLFMATIFFIYGLSKINILKSSYVVIISLISILIDILFTRIIFSKKTKVNTKVVITILSIIISIVYLVAYIYIDNTRAFIKKISENKYEYTTYSVVVLNESSYNSIDDLKDTKMGYLNNQNKLDRKLNIEKVSYENITNALLGLEENEISSIVLADEYLGLLGEANSDVLNRVRVIYTFKLRKKKQDVKEIDTTEPFILYISGSDSRVSVKEAARSDVNIVVVINPKTHKILLVSIPRDTYIDLYNRGAKDKLTHTGVYGIDMSINTIEQFLNIDINHYLKVSFATLIDLVDIIDGIDIYADKEFVPYTDRTCKFIEGVQHVNGKCALAFSRERKTYETGDRHRGENQEQVIVKIFEKMNNPKYLTKYNEILNKIEYSIETSMSYDEITSLIKNQLDTLSSYQIESYNIDGNGTYASTYSMGSQKLYVMIPDQNTIDIANIKIREYLDLTNE